MACPNREPKIALIQAAVYEEQQYHDEIQRDTAFIVRTPPGTMRLGLRVVLSAVLDDGRRVDADNSFGIAGPRKMTLHEVNELIDRMLGRDTKQHRPPRLAWPPLLSALARIDVHVFESNLIAAPFELRVEPSARRALTLD